MDLVRMIAGIKEDYHPDLARLLILLRSFGGEDGFGPFDGLTKLAKLDFLLRYPLFLEKALEVKKADSSKVDVKDFERNSVEAKMIRFRYGPWDPRHRQLVNLLVAVGLAKASEESATKIELTELGVKTAEQLAQQYPFRDITQRAILLKRFFDRTGNWLKKFVYRTFPEIVTLRYGEEITYERLKKTDERKV